MSAARKNRYSPEMLGFLMASHADMTRRELADIFNRKFNKAKSLGCLTSVLRSHKMIGRPSSCAGPSWRYTPEMLDFLREGYRTMTAPQLTEAFNEQFQMNKKEASITFVLRYYKIRSPNPPKAYAFGVPRTGVDACGFVSLKIKCKDPVTGRAKTRAVYKHRAVWEEANGPVPEGYLVTFIDGNKLNCQIENLMLLTLTANLFLCRNNYHDLPPELQPTLLAAAQLYAKARALEKNAEDVRSKKRESIAC